MTASSGDRVAPKPRPAPRDLVIVGLRNRRLLARTCALLRAEGFGVVPPDQSHAACVAVLDCASASRLAGHLAAQPNVVTVLLLPEAGPKGMLARLAHTPSILLPSNALPRTLLAAVRAGARIAGRRIDLSSQVHFLQEEGLTVQDELREAQTLKRGADMRNAALTYENQMLTDRLAQSDQVYEVLQSQSQFIKETSVELQELSRTDGLTGLPNHREFKEHIKRHQSWAVAGNWPVSLILADIDHFKSVNDRHGHPYGDEVLRTVARVLREAAGEKAFCARYGGEEFAVILPGYGGEDALAAAERLRQAVETAALPHGKVSASFGIGTGQPGKWTVEKLVEDADAGLYEAKRGGRNRVCAVTSPESLSEAA